MEKRRRIVIGSGDPYLGLSALHNFCGVAVCRNLLRRGNFMSEVEWNALLDRGARNEWRKIE